MPHLMARRVSAATIAMAKSAPATFESRGKGSTGLSGWGRWNRCGFQWPVTQGNPMGWGSGCRWPGNSPCFRGNPAQGVAIMRLSVNRAMPRGSSQVPSPGGAGASCHCELNVSTFAVVLGYDAYQQGRWSLPTRMPCLRFWATTIQNPW